MIKCIGLLAKVNFDRNVGVDSIYLKGYLPTTGQLVRIGLGQATPSNHSVLSNLLKTIGMFGHHSSVNPQRSKQYYVELLEMKFGELSQ